MGLIQMLFGRSSEEAVIFRIAQFPIMSLYTEQVLHRPRRAEAKMAEAGRRTCFGSISATAKVYPLIIAKHSSLGPHQSAEKHPAPTGPLGSSGS